MDINKVLNNSNNVYYGHGTGGKDKEVTNSILKYGLRCSHGSVYYTTCILGMGNQIAPSEIELMKHWPHLDSKTIIVVSLPIKYRILEGTGLGTYEMGDAAFYYTPDEKIREENPVITNSPYVLPEFIAGYYDADNDTFIENEKYYEKLPQEEQDKLFEQVKQNYFDIIDDGCGMKYYQEVLQDLGYECPITNEDIEQYKRNKIEKDLLSKVEPFLKQEVVLQNEKIPALKYLKEYVFPYIPLGESIILKNGNKLPIYHFIVECVLYDCVNNYQGDINKYLANNVDIEATLEANKEKEENKMEAIL